MVLNGIGKAPITVVIGNRDPRTLVALNREKPHAGWIRDAKIAPELALIAVVDLHRVVRGRRTEVIPPRACIRIAARIDDQWASVRPEHERQGIRVAMGRKVWRAQ